MSEHAPDTGHEKFDILKDSERKTLPTAEQAEPLRAGEADPTKKLEAAREAVEANAMQKNPLEAVKAEETAAQPAPTIINRELKNLALDRSLKQLQRKLPAPQRVLSKVVHQKAVRVVSEAAGKTVSRPSGLLGGGLVAFLGSSTYLYFAKHLGFHYNYLVFLLLFIGGFAVGLLLELAVWVATRKHRVSE